MTDQLTRLLRIMATLRDPERGCEWDRAQRFETIVHIAFSGLWLYLSTVFWWAAL